MKRSIDSRKNLVDTKLATAEGGSLTKDMVALTQGLSITGRDCKSEEGLPVSREEEVWLVVENLSGEQIKKLLKKETGEKTERMITGILGDKKGLGKPDDYALWTDQNPKDFQKAKEKINHSPSRKPPRLIGIRIKRPISNKPEELKEILFGRLYGRVLDKEYGEYKRFTFIDKEQASAIARKIIETGDRALIRSPLLCKEKNGICQVCYGLPMTRGRKLNGWGKEDLVPLNTRAGIIAAQAVGEPGTQMALRKKHLAGSKKSGEENLLGINEANRIIQSNSPLRSEGDPSICRDTIDHLYRSFGTNLAVVHFEMLFAGFCRVLSMKEAGNAGWIGLTAHPDRHLEKNSLRVLAVSALDGNEDMLAGLKERVLIGSYLPFLMEGIE